MVAGKNNYYSFYFYIHVSLLADFRLSYRCIKTVDMARIISDHLELFTSFVVQEHA